MATSTPVNLDPPGLTRRLACMAYESLLLFGVICCGFVLPHVLLGMLAQLQLPYWLIRAHFFLLLMLYYVWCWVHGGQTLALKTWGLKIVDQSGAPVRPLQAALRYMAAWPSLLCFGVGIFWVFFNQDKQFLHDRLSGTRIIRIHGNPAAG